MLATLVAAIAGTPSWILRESLQTANPAPLRLADGREITDAIVSRRSHWTESFRAIDWDADGLQDLIYSVAGSHNGTKDGGSIYLLRNVGTKTAPVFAEPVTMCCFGEPIRITNHGIIISQSSSISTNHYLLISICTTHIRIMTYYYIIISSN